jgi:uncharacterized protein (UPF0276 family)
MRLGINWTSPVAANVIRELLDKGEADFCELLIDNFIHLRPDEVRKVLGSIPVSFHIMWSKFIERDKDSLSQIARYIRLWIKEIEPIYVSDHVAQFTVDERNLPLLAELNYDDISYTKVRDRVMYWQDKLHTSVLLENFPSSLDYDGNQIEFYTRLMSDTGCGMLFDFSNAVVAEINCGVDASQWIPLFDRTVSHYHVAGFRKTDGDPKLAIDTHDVPVSDRSFNFLETVFSNTDYDATKNRTIVVERDANINFESWAKDLRRLRSIQI